MTGDGGSGRPLEPKEKAVKPEQGEPVDREKLDALFSGEPPPPPLEAGPRIQRLRRVLAVAIPLDILGIPCWTGVPGAALTLWAWLDSDAAMAAVETGQYSSVDAASLISLRRWSAWALGFCVFSLLMQAWMLSTPFYGVLYGWLIGLLG